MSAREWKAGDVARVSWSGGPWNGRSRDNGPHTEVAIRTADNMWSLASSWSDCLRDEDVHAIEPLLLIDPEVLEQANRLTGLYNTSGQEGRNGQRMQCALRKMLEPPKPDEPTGLGAVVVDKHGDDWHLTASGRWIAADGLQTRSYPWDGIEGPVVRSPGITPDEPDAEEALPPDLVDRTGCTWRYGVKGDFYSRWLEIGGGLWSSGRVERAELEDVAGPLREIARSAVTP